MQVRIFKCTQHFWYADKLGEIFNVILDKKADKYFIVTDDKYNAYHINKDDCEIVDYSCKEDDLEIEENKNTVLNNIDVKKEFNAYIYNMMDKIDDAKKRQASNDLSVIAYELINKLVKEFIHAK